MRNIAAMVGIACAVLSLAVTSNATYHAAVGGDGINGRSIVVRSIVDGRVPFPGTVLHVEVEPDAPPQTPVHWSSPDGMNEFADTGANSFERELDTTLDARVAIVPHANDHGPATIVADIGAPVHLSVKVAVRDEVAIGFGCYVFMRDGPSVRIVDGFPQRSSLADSDIAVLGPAGFGGPGYGCWGENVDSTATTYRLVFNHGGRVALGVDRPFVKQLPIDSVGESPLDVLGGDGHRYRLHLTLGAGMYFIGWIETGAATAAAARRRRFTIGELQRLSFAQSIPLHGVRVKITGGYAAYLILGTQGATPVLQISANANSHGDPVVGCYLTSYAARDAGDVAKYVNSHAFRSPQQQVTVVGVLGNRESASAALPGSINAPASGLPVFDGNPPPYASRPGLWELDECRLVL